jgi:hypothetical protein
MIRLIDVLQFIRPGAEFYISGDELTWVDEVQTQPTAAEIKAGWIACEAAQQAEADAKAAQKAALLERLGISEDEAKLLLA